MGLYQHALHLRQDLLIIKMTKAYRITEAAADAGATPFT